MNNRGYSVLPALGLGPANRIKPAILGRMAVSLVVVIHGFNLVFAGLFLFLDELAVLVHEFNDFIFGVAYTSRLLDPR